MNSRRLIRLPRRAHCSACGGDSQGLRDLRFMASSILADAARASPPVLSFENAPDVGAGQRCPIGRRRLIGQHRPPFVVFLTRRVTAVLPRATLL